LKTSLTHSLAVNWTNRLNRYVRKDGLELKKMTLGMEIILHNIPKLILMLAVSAFLGLLVYSLITWAAFVCIRRYASGLHASNGIVCTFTTLLMFVAVPYAMRFVYIGVVGLLFVSALVGIGLYRYAPADTEARPIIGKKKRARLKRNALVANVVVLALTLVFLGGEFYGHVAAGIFFAVLVLLPVMYSVLGRSMNNYEKFE